MSIHQDVEKEVDDAAVQTTAEGKEDAKALAKDQARQLLMDLQNEGVVCNILQDAALMAASNDIEKIGPSLDSLLTSCSLTDHVRLMRRYCRWYEKEQTLQREGGDPMMHWSRVLRWFMDLIDGGCESETLQASLKTFRQLGVTFGFDEDVSSNERLRELAVRYAQGKDCEMNRT